MSRRKVSEEMHLLLPVGSSASTWESALEVGRRFASEYIDRAPGLAGAVIYGGGAKVSFVAYWTAKRRVVVYAQEEVAR